MPSRPDSPRPPEPPEIEPEFRLLPGQWVGICLLLAIPLLALAGVFGESRETGRARTAELAIQVSHPDRFRFKMLSGLRVDVTNTTAAVLDTVTIDIDTAYLGRFSTVAAIPAFERPYTIRLIDLEPGETRRVQVEIQGEHYGRHHGEIRIGAAGADTARLPVRTFVFP